MCGRYQLSKSEKEIRDELDAEVDEDYSPHYNIAPSQQLAVLKNDHAGVLRFARQKWGLIPYWAKDPKIGFSMINARSESIFEKPTFTEAFKKRRCLIPADGFYEWKKKGKTKQPFNFRMKDDSIFAFAGIWERWKSPEGQLIESCSILTTTPNELVAHVHDRMPVIIPKKQYGVWLSTEPERAEQLRDLLVPYTAEEMSRFPVSSLVNSPRNDVADCAKATSID